MVMSSRIKEIIEIVLNSKGYITIGEISKKMGVSERTIYREIPEVSMIMQKNGVSLSSVSKKGLLATGSLASIQELRNYLNQQEDIMIVDPKERSDYIILYLAREDDYIKAEAIAIDNQTSVPTVRNDLKKIKQKLANYDLQLIQKKGEGILINGKRMEKNHLIVDAILEHASEVEIYQWLNDSGEVANPFLQRLEEFSVHDVMRRFHRLLKASMEQVLKDISNVSDREYIEMVFLLAFLVYYHLMEHPYHDFMESDLQGEQVQKLYQQIADAMEDEFSMTLSENERSYVRWVLQLCILARVSHTTTIRNQTLNPDIANFIHYVEDKLGIYLSRDVDLKDGLYCHLDKALSRIRSNMSISNPATAEIKDKYEELFAIIRQGVRELFPNDYFPDDEIAYLVLYFAVALDKFTKKAFRVLVVCSSGIGSSKMLANRLEHDIPELSVEKIVALVALDKENLDQYDLVLSTVPLYLDDSEYMYVSPMLKENELEKIKEKIKRHKHRTLRKIETRERERDIFETGNSLETLKKINYLTQMCMDIMTTFQMVDIMNGVDMKTDAKKTLEMYQQFGMFRDAKEIPENAAKNRGFVIPTTDISYYEEAYENMKQPLLFINVYPEPQNIEGDDEDVYSYEIVLFCSNQLEKHEQSMLQHLVDLFISDVDLFNLIEDQNEKAIREWIGYRLRQYLGEMMR